MTESQLQFWLIRRFYKNGKPYLAHHSYKTWERRERWAHKYRARGEQVKLEGFTRG